MKEILITNDDGFEARGLKELAKALKSVANVTIVAPSSEKSACGHSLTCTKPLKFIQIDDGFFKLDDATPSDCVYLALHALYDKKPDFVVSGINHGANVCEDITYSGTCAGAMEAVLQGIPALAVSQFYDDSKQYNFDLACEITLNLVEKIFANGYPLAQKQFLNLNVPCVNRAAFKGLKIAPVGTKIYQTFAQVNQNPRLERYYWLGATSFDFEISHNQNTDISLLMQGYATLTPLMLNLTATSQMQNLSKWLKND